MGKHHDAACERPRRLRPAVLYVLAAIVGTIIIGFGIFYLLLAANDADWQRNLGVLLRQGLGLVCTMVLFAGIYVLHRFLMIPIDRFFLPWIRSSQHTRHERPGIPNASKPDRAVKPLPVPLQDFKHYVLYTAFGLMMGTTLGIVVFFFGTECWDHVFSSSSASTRGGGPIDSWARGITRLIVLTVVTLPFAVTGLVAGIKIAAATARKDNRAEWSDEAQL